MPHAQLKLAPGADVIRTPVLNEAGVSDCSGIRYLVDQAGTAYPQQIGGWTRYYPNSIEGIPRALWAWQDTNHSDHLAIGCQTSTGTPSLGAPLEVITDGAKSVITPRFRVDNPAVDVSSTSGSNVFTIVDTGSNINGDDSVFISTHISIGGVVLFGFYPCVLNSADSFDIDQYDSLGNVQNATSGVPDAGAVAVFDSTNASVSIAVTLNDHGYVAGDTYPVLVSTTVGGVVLLGNYIVQSVTDANTFVITANIAATSTETVSINGGNAQLIFYFGGGPLTIGTGFGVGGFGLGGFGTGTVTTALPGDALEATDWTLDNGGNLLVACPFNTNAGPDTTPPIGGPVYLWDPTANQILAAPISSGGAPVCNDGAFVGMPQRQIIAWGSTAIGQGVQDHLLLRWCDINNFFNWYVRPGSQAGFYRIPRGSRIVAGLQVATQGLIFTDVGVWSMQYVSVPDIYDFNEIGIGCGLIGRKAVVTMNGGVYWMGRTQFFSLSGGGVAPIPCPIWDAVFQNLDTSNVDKIRAAANSQFNEIIWYYPSLSGGGEVDSYVKFAIIDGAPVWDFGSNAETPNIARSAWINEGILGSPIGASPVNSVIYQHETSINADGQPLRSKFRTGWFALSEGDQMIFVDECWPDMKWGYRGQMQNATIQLTFYHAAYPTDTPLVDGPHTLTTASTFITPRFRNRLMAIEIVSNTIDSWWRLGGIRYRYAPDGRY